MLFAGPHGANAGSAAGPDHAQDIHTGLRSFYAQCVFADTTATAALLLPHAVYVVIRWPSGRPPLRRQTFGLSTADFHTGKTTPRHNSTVLAGQNAVSPLARNTCRGANSWSDNPRA